MNRTADQIARLAARVVDADKTVIVEVDSEDLATLKDGDYRLCFAKMAGGASDLTFDVVWQAYSEYFSYNYFSYLFDYQLFCTNNFEDGAQVRTRTNLVDIDLGEESTLDQYGVLSPASSGTDEDAFVLNNEYDPIHPGLNQVAVNLEGESQNSPFYVNEAEVVIGESSVTTVDRVLVWFEQNAETGVMFSTARSNSIEVDLTSTDLATVLFQQGVWSLQPNAAELAVLVSESVAPGRHES